MAVSSKSPENSPEHVAHDLHRSALHLLRHLRNVDRDLGISAPRLSLLSVLVFVGPKSVGDLATIEQVSQPTISNQIKDMEAAGLIRVATDQTDKRSKRIEATAKGKKLLNDGRSKRVAQLANMMAGLTVAELRTLTAASKIIDGMLSE